MTSEVVDSVANTVVDLERHLERLLEEEVSLLINLSLIVDLATVLLVETACDVTLPLPQTHHPVNLTLRINQSSAPARTHSCFCPCAVFCLLQTSDYLLHIDQRRWNRLYWLLNDRWWRDNNLREI